MCEMVSCNVLNDVSKCYYVAEMDENKYQYQYQYQYQTVAHNEPAGLMLQTKYFQSCSLGSTSCGSSYLLVIARSTRWH
jgi:hypothetical protein